VNDKMERSAICCVLWHYIGISVRALKVTAGNRDMNTEPLKQEKADNKFSPEILDMSYRTHIPRLPFVPKCQNLPLSLPSLPSMSSPVTSVGSLLPPGRMAHRALISLNRKLCQVLKLLSI
jgi:hypothetical protein